MSDPQGPRLTWLGQLFVLLFIGACGFGAWALFLKKPINADPSAPAQPSKSFFGGDSTPVEIGIAYGTEKQRWLQWAVELHTKQDALFGDAGHGGYFSVQKDAPHILLRMKEDYDGAKPSPNSVAALNLLRLAQITDRKDFRERAAKTLAAFADQLTRSPTALPQMLVALDASLAEPRQFVIAGPRDDPATRALLRETRRHFLPNTLVLLADGGAGQKWLGERLEFVKTVGPLDGKPAAYVCRNFVCQLPTSDVVKLRELLAK